MRLQTSLKIAGALALTGIVAACGGNDNGAASTSSGTTSSFESKFGSEFAMIFDASSTSQPATPDSNAVPPLAPAGQPISTP